MKSSYPPQCGKRVSKVKVAIFGFFVLLLALVAYVGLLAAAEYYVCYVHFDPRFSFLQNVRSNHSRWYEAFYTNLPVDNLQAVTSAAERSLKETFNEEFVVTDLKWHLRPQDSRGVSWLVYQSRDIVEGFASPKSNPDIRFRAWGSMRKPALGGGDKSEYIRKSWQVQFKKEMVQLLGTEDLRAEVRLDFAYEKAGISYDTTLSSLVEARKRYSPYFKYWVETYVYVPFDASRKVRKKVDSLGNKKYYPIVGDASTDVLAEKLVQEMQEKVFNVLSKDAAEIVCIAVVLEESCRDEAHRVMREREKAILGTVVRFNDLSRLRTPGQTIHVTEWAAENDALLSYGMWSWPPLESDAALSADAVAK